MGEGDFAVGHGNLGQEEGTTLYDEYRPQGRLVGPRQRLIRIGGRRNQAGRSYFAGRGLRQFNLGFSGDDGQAFFAKMAIKYELHPRVLVIGIDPYFNDWMSPPAAAATGSAFEAARGVLKKAQIALQPMLCRRGVLNRDAGQHTAFRSSKDGYFVWRDVLMPDRERHRARQTRRRDFQVHVPNMAKAAKAFLDGIHMSANCAVMAAMPLPEIWPKPDPLKQVAEAVGAMYIDADTGEDLTFVDEMHLSYWSAKRFSAEFLHQFDRLPQTCLGGASNLQAGAAKRRTEAG